MIKKILSCIVAFCIITVIFGIIYAAVQQDFRQSANDPQIQMAEDTVALLVKGDENVQQILEAYPEVNFAQSLAPFIVVYDQNGTVISSTGNMDGTTPTPPLGALQAAKTLGQNRVTWQPASDVRIAAVVVPYSYQGTSGFVLAGRSLYEVEARESKLTLMVFVGWALSVVGLVVLFVISLF